MRSHAGTPNLVLSEFGALSVKIKVAKPAILPRLKALGVVIERGVKN